MNEHYVGLMEINRQFERTDIACTSGDQNALYKRAEKYENTEQSGDESDVP